MSCLKIDNHRNLSFKAEFPLLMSSTRDNSRWSSTFHHSSRKIWLFHLSANILSIYLNAPRSIQTYGNMKFLTSKRPVKVQLNFFGIVRLRKLFKLVFFVDLGNQALPVGGYVGRDLRTVLTPRNSSSSGDSLSPSSPSSRSSLTFPILEPEDLERYLMLEWKTRCVHAEDYVCIDSFLVSSWSTGPQIDFLLNSYCYFNWRIINWLLSKYLLNTLTLHFTEAINLIYFVT